DGGSVGEVPPRGAAGGAGGGAGVAHRAHPAGPSACLPDGPSNIWGSSSVTTSTLLPRASSGPDRATVPERRHRAVLRALRGLHAREVLPPLALRLLRSRGGDVRGLRSRRRLGPSG